MFQRSMSTSPDFRLQSSTLTAVSGDGQDISMGLVTQTGPPRHQQLSLGLMGEQEQKARLWVRARAGLSYSEGAQQGGVKMMSLNQ